MNCRYIGYNSYIPQEVIVMEKHKPVKEDTAQQAVIRRIILNYFNNVLLEQGVITKDEHLQMKAMINSKYNSRTT